MEQICFSNVNHFGVSRKNPLPFAELEGPLPFTHLSSGLSSVPDLI
jgi:hypothetical protein